MAATSTDNLHRGYWYRNPISLACELPENRAGPLTHFPNHAQHGALPGEPELLGTDTATQVGGGDSTGSEIQGDH